MTASAVPTSSSPAPGGVRVGPLVGAIILLAGILGGAGWLFYTNLFGVGASSVSELKVEPWDERWQGITNPQSINRGRVNFSNNTIQIRLPMVTIDAQAQNNWKPDGYFDGLFFLPSTANEALSAARNARTNSNAASEAKVTEDQLNRLKNVHAPVEGIDAPETAKARLAAAIMAYVNASADARKDLQKPLLEAAQAFASAGLPSTVDQDLRAAREIMSILTPEQLRQLGGMGRGMGFGMFGGGNRNRNNNAVAPGNTGANNNNAGNGVWRRNNNNNRNGNPGGARPATPNNEPAPATPAPTTPATPPAASPAPN